MMSKSDFERVGRVIQEITEQNGDINMEGRQRIAEKFASAFAEPDPERFNPAKFFQACGIFPCPSANCGNVFGTNLQMERHWFNTHP